jgi:hypothetical protein
MHPLEAKLGLLTEVFPDTLLVHEVISKLLTDQGHPPKGSRVPHSNMSKYLDQYL